MIFQHVADALRRQDWAAVAIEFALVVAGVLLAFQINEWASKRHAAAEQEAATSRLLYEAEDDVAYFRYEVGQHQEQVRNLSYALGQMQEGSWRGADQEQMRAGLTSSVYLDVPSPPSSVYDDIVAAGLLGEIGDPRLRSAIGVYRAKVALLSRLVDYIRQTAPKLDREESLRYVFDETGSRPARLEVNFAALERNKDLQSSLALLNDRQAFILRNWEESLRAAIIMCRELGRNLRKSCDTNHATTPR